MSDTNVNKNHKDRLFRLLFGSEEYKDNTLSLYNALRGTDYTNVDDIEITTMDDSIYMKMKNDVSFLVFSYMELYEHQSSYNPNMPIRGLIYIGGLFDKYIKTHNLDVYSSRKLELPTPRYVVFYNGDKDAPDRETTRLSELFSNPEESCLEMTVDNYNINYGHNKYLLDKCKALKQYAQFVEQIKYNRKNGMSVEDAVCNAVDYCIEHDILKELLLARKSEVILMCITEYNEILHIANEKKLSYTEGENKLAKLMSFLLGQGRNDDAARAAEDEEYRKQMYREAGIID